MYIDLEPTFVIMYGETDEDPSDKKVRAQISHTPVQKIGNARTFGTIMFIHHAGVHLAPPSLKVSAKTTGLQLSAGHTRTLFRAHR